MEDSTATPQVTQIDSSWLFECKSTDELASRLRDCGHTVTSHDLREMYGVPEQVSDEESLLFIKSAVLKIASESPQEDDELQNVTGGYNTRYAGSLDPISMGGMSPGYGDAMKTAAYVGLAGSVIGGGMSLGGTIANSKGSMKLSAQTHAQDLEFLEKQTDAQIKLIKAQNGIFE